MALTKGDKIIANAVDTTGFLQGPNIAVKEIKDNSDQDQSSSITLSGGSGAATVHIDAQGEDMSASIKLQGSRSDHSAVEIKANDISFNNIQVPRDKSGTIALLSDISSGGENIVKYIDDTAESLADLIAREDDEGDRQPTGPVFGRFTSGVGNTIGVKSDGVYLYMPWSTNGTDYGHLIAANDTYDEEDSDNSLFHASLDGGISSHWRRVLDSDNWQEYISTGYKARTYQTCKIPVVGSDNYILEQYNQVMTGYSYIKIGNYVSMRLDVPRLRSYAGDAYYYYTLPFNFTKGSFYAIPKTYYKNTNTRRSASGADCSNATYSSEFTGKQIGLYAPEGATWDECQEYGLNRGTQSYSLSWYDGWDTILLDGYIGG